MLRLPRVRTNKIHELAKYVQLMLNIHKDLYVDIKDISVEYFDAWDFCKVSVFRYSRCSHGNGSKSYRDIRWLDTKTAMRELFDMYLPEDSTWRWKDHYSCYDNEEIETVNCGQIPGVLYFIKLEDVGK